MYRANDLRLCCKFKSTFKMKFFEVDLYVHLEVLYQFNARTEYFIIRRNL